MHCICKFEEKSSSYPQAISVPESTLPVGSGNEIDPEPAQEACVMSRRYLPKTFHMQIILCHKGEHKNLFM